MEIVRLLVKNFLSITDVDLQPGKITQITGRNGQGKSSLIKALAFAVKGSADGTLVQFGKESAEVIVELADSTTIRRRVTAEGKQSVEVKKDGFNAPKPQAYLDALFNESAFNPLSLLDPKTRADSILSAIDLKVTPEVLAAELEVDADKLPPIDYAQHGLKVIDQAHRFYYQRRAEANKDAAEKKRRYDTYLNDLPAKEPETTKTRAEIQALVDEIGARVDAAKGTLDTILKARERVGKYEKAVREIDEQIAALQARREEGLKFVEAARKEAPSDENSEREAMRQVNDLAIEREKVKGQFAAADYAESVTKHRARVDEMLKEYETAKAFAEALTLKVDRLFGPIKRKLMEQADLPVKGLQYHEGCFLVDSVRVEHMESSATIRLAVAIARKLSRKTKIVCIDGAEALDEHTYSALHKEIEGDGFTYFISCVGDGFDEPNDKKVEMSKGEAVVR